MALEELLHREGLDLALISLVDLFVLRQIGEHVQIQGRLGPVVQRMVQGEIKQQDPGQGPLVILRQGVQIIFVEPGQMDVLADALFVPGEGFPSPSVAADEQGANRRQKLFPRIQAVELL